MRIFSGSAAILIATVALALHPVLAAADPVDERIALPAPQLEGGMALMEALALRRSTRAFSERDLDKQMLANLLWVAFGINRIETADHTAPSWRGSKETDIYVARSDGVWLYDPHENALARMIEEDIREETGRQPFTDNAPVVLIYVADLARMAEAPREDQQLYAHVDAALSRRTSICSQPRKASARWCSAMSTRRRSARSWIWVRTSYSPSPSQSAFPSEMKASQLWSLPFQHRLSRSPERPSLQPHPARRSETGPEARPPPRPRSG